MSGNFWFSSVCVDEEVMACSAAFSLPWTVFITKNHFLIFGPTFLCGLIIYMDKRTNSTVSMVTITARIAILDANPDCSCDDPIATMVGDEYMLVVVVCDSVVGNVAGELMLAVVVTNSVTVSY